MVGRRRRLPCACGVESFPVAGGLVGFGGEVSWKRPTRPNDVLHVESEITELRRSQSKPNQGVITLFSQTKNQNDEVVQESTTKILVWSKDSVVK